ncbi:hypothetical protein [Paenibacillus ferrarius]|uniref:hypothetical protein n=1 Tax=Paenibacillus ferrarius TaxID=1469647 RepID=UPI00117F69F7|nr:hypothetical protein [Paenibacillus ferrarius]
MEILAEVNDWIAQAVQQAEREAEAKLKSSKRDREDDDNDAGGSQLTMEVGDAFSVPEEPPAVAKKPRNMAKKLHVLPPTAAKVEEVTNKGTLMLDATCAPADIKYPTDLGLLNHAREILEDIIGVLHRPHVGAMEKPRTYREKARKS